MENLLIVNADDFWFSQKVKTTALLKPAAGGGDLNNGTG